MNKLQRQQIKVQRLDALGNELAIDDIVLTVYNTKLFKAKLLSISHDGLELALYKKIVVKTDSKNVVKLYFENKSKQKWLKFILNK
jgi:hypothetical protein